MPSFFVKTVACHDTCIELFASVEECAELQQNLLYNEIILIPFRQEISFIKKIDLI